MKFGVFFVTESPDRDFRRAYAETLEQIEYAEHLGFDTVWLAEHHGSTYGSMPSGSVMASAIAQRTKTMRIGMAVSILPFNNPVRIAEEYAMVDVLSEGRLDFGVGRGYQPSEYEMLGLADRQDDSRTIFQESLDISPGCGRRTTSPTTASTTTSATRRCIPSRCSNRTRRSSSRRSARRPFGWSPRRATTFSSPPR